ncbi:MAG: NnrS family protein [Pseudomonadota bacterium]
MAALRLSGACATFLSYGFRPFFLGASLFATVGILVWLPIFLGAMDLPLGLAARDWHIHEMVYGYAAAAIAGFLFTALPNWTGRPPVSGWLLLVLAAAWLAGRIALAASGLIGMEAAAAVDLVFLVMVAAIAGREIVASGNRRNLKLLVVLGVLIVGNAVFHLEVLLDGMAFYGSRIGLAAAVGLIVLIGGRIVPNFTRNALLRAGPGPLPAPFDRFDMSSMAATVAGLVAWVVVPQDMVTAAIAAVAGVLLAVRLTRWVGYRALGDRLVLVLHVAYAFVPAGFLLIALSIVMPDVVTSSAGAHAWGVGAIGLMTLAVMTRATLGHTGRQLVATPATVVVYGLVVFAALARIGAAIPSSAEIVLLHVAACAWAAAFVGFAAIYGPMLLRPKVTAGPPGC